MEATFGTSGAVSPIHLPPEVIWLPLGGRRPQFRPRLVVGVGVLAALVPPVLYFCGVILEPLYAGSGGILLFALVVAVVSALSERRERAAGAAACEQRHIAFEAVADERLRAELRRLWPDDGPAPAAARLARLFAEYSPEPLRPRIIALGARPPAAVSAEAEPLLIPLAGAEVLLALVAVPGAFIALALAGVQGPLPALLATLGGAAVGVLLAYAAFRLRPRYLRLAPRLLEVVQYALFRRGPRVERTSIDGGAVVVVVEPAPGTRWTIQIYLPHDRYRWPLSLGFARSHAEARRRLWATLLAPAPGPPTSDTELVG